MFIHLKIPTLYLEYLPFAVLLWNYPPIATWNASQQIYTVAIFASTMANVAYANAMHVFMTESNVLENYNRVLTSHIYKTIVNGMASHMTAYAVHSRQHNTYGLMFFASLMIHILVSYMYYFGDLTYTHRYALLVKQIPHLVDVVIILGCIADTDLQKCILIANAGMLVSIYMKNHYIYKMFSMVELYSISIYL